MDVVRSADGTRIAFDRSGRGPALVLVVGAMCDRSSTKTLAAGLGSLFTVYEYDRRGRGDSGDTLPYSTAREVEDLAAIVEAAGGSALGFGHSSGACLVLEAAASGVPLRKLAVYEPPYTDGPSIEFGDRQAELLMENRRTEVVERHLTLVGMPAEAIQQMKDGPYWEHMLSFAPTLVYEIRLANDGQPPIDRLAKISIPILALAGGASPAWSREVAQVVAATVHNGQLRVLPDQSHGVADDVLIPVLTSFF